MIHTGNHTHTHLYERSDGTERAGAAEVWVLRTQQDGGVKGTLTSLHLHLHQTILVPGTVLHQVNQQAQTLNTNTHTHKRARSVDHLEMVQTLTSSEILHHSVS